MEVKTLCAKTNIRTLDNTMILVRNYTLICDDKYEQFIKDNYSDILDIVPVINKKKQEVIS